MSRRPKATAVRAGNCIYLEEPFPTAGELINISSIEVEFLYNQSAYPDTWTGMVRSIRERTGEPDEPRVLTNLLGTLVAMADGTFTKLASLVGEEPAARGSTMLKQGIDPLADYRACFSTHRHGGNAFDFEIIKCASLLASDRSLQARREQDWPYPDLWNGDLAVFRGLIP